MTNHHAALAAQRELVDEWEAEYGPFDDEDLRPFLETALRAQIENTMRILRGTHWMLGGQRAAIGSSPGRPRHAGCRLGRAILPRHHADDQP
jgi:hypothetical protein